MSKIVTERIPFLALTLINTCYTYVINKGVSFGFVK